MCKVLFKKAERRTSMAKNFNQQDFLDFDVSARAKAKIYLENAGYKVEDNVDKYGVDLVCECSHGRKFAVEVEVKKGWAGEFTFPTLHIPYRKAKFINGSTLFFVFSSNLWSVGIVTSDALKASPIVTVPNYKVLGSEEYFESLQEKFFDVPKDKVKFVRLTF